MSYPAEEALPTAAKGGDVTPETDKVPVAGSPVPYLGGYVVSTLGSGIELPAARDCGSSVNVVERSGRVGSLPGNSVSVRRDVAAAKWNLRDGLWKIFPAGVLLADDRIVNSCDPEFPAVVVPVKRTAP